MKTIGFAMTLLFSSFAATCNGQALQGDSVLLDSSFPYVKFQRTGESSHYIDCLSDQLAFIVTGGGSSYKFRILENSQTDALVVDSSGISVSDSGSGTQIEINQTDTDQQFGVTSLSSNFGLNNGGIGFKTSSASYPFYVFDTARTESLSVRAEGVGLGTYDAAYPLHVYADGFPYAEAKVYVENNLSGVPVNREMFALVNNGGSQFSFTDTSAGSKWVFSTNSNSVFAITLAGTGGNELAVQPNGRVIMGPGGAKNFDLLPNGNLKIAGTLTQSSDKNLKTAFVNVEVASVLDRVAKMPVQTWQFKFDAPELRHMGPTAQDFHAAFGLGIDDKTIAPVDGIGVSLAAIKALHDQDIEKDLQIENLKTKLAKHQTRLDQQERQLAKQNQLLTELASRLEQLEVNKTQQIEGGRPESRVVRR